MKSIGLVVWLMLFFMSAVYIVYRVGQFIGHGTASKLFAKIGG